MPRSPGLVLPTVLSGRPSHREGKLRIVLTDYEPEPMPVHLAHAGQGLLPLKMRSFLEYAAPRLRKSPASDQSKLDKGIAKARSLRSKAGLKVR